MTCTRRAVERIPRALRGFAVAFVLFMFDHFGLNTCAAAGFECARATSKVEKMICASAELSRLDGELREVYKDVLKSSLNQRAIVEGQRQWLARERGRCGNHACLENAYKTRLFLLKSRRNDARTCAIGEPDFVGHWLRVEGGQFEEFLTSGLAEGREFVSMLHGGPEYSGTWSLTDCVVQIRADNTETPSFYYRILGFEENVLYLEDTQFGETASYRKRRKDL